MDISLLKTFLEVARTRHFGRASDTLFITQSAVSARIKLLEEILGVELFIRKRNDIQLTPAGYRLHQHAEHIVKGWERARRAIALDAGHSVSLTVGCVHDFWKIFVQQWSSSLRKLDADIALQIEMHSTTTLIERLTLGILDLAFMFDPPQTPDLELKKVADVPLILVSTDPDQTSAQVMSQNYVMVDWGSAFNAVHDEHFPDLQPPMLRTNTGDIALGLIEDAGGGAYLPEALVRQRIAEGRLFHVEQSPVIKRLGYVVYRPENLSRQSVRKALEFISDD
ncbi:MAG: LysR family transcriptional regulator [Sedimenticola sp.]|nr:MAG: LysR family transcriptional regulator [Sedimenticola sp.]